MHPVPNIPTPLRDLATHLRRTGSVALLLSIFALVTWLSKAITDISDRDVIAAGLLIGGVIGFASLHFLVAHYVIQSRKAAIQLSLIVGAAWFLPCIVVVALVAFHPGLVSLLIPTLCLLYFALETIRLSRHSLRTYYEMTQRGFEILPLSQKAIDYGKDMSP